MHVWIFADSQGPRSCYFFVQETRTVDVGRLSLIQVELHDLGFFEAVILGAVTFPVNLGLLYPEPVQGFFDLMPTNGTPGAWRNSRDSCPVIEMAMKPVDGNFGTVLSPQVLGPWSAGPLSQALVMPSPSAPQASHLGEQPEVEEKAKEPEAQEVVQGPPVPPPTAEAPPPAVKAPPPSVKAPPPNAMPPPAAKAPLPEVHGPPEVHSPPVPFKAPPANAPPAKAPPAKALPPVLPQADQYSKLRNHLFEVAVDYNVWQREEWIGFDRLGRSLVQRVPLPGMVRGQVSVTGLALGYDTGTMDYAIGHSLGVTSWVSAEAVELVWTASMRAWPRSRMTTQPRSRNTLFGGSVSSGHGRRTSSPRS